MSDWYQDRIYLGAAWAVYENALVPSDLYQEISWTYPGCIQKHPRHTFNTMQGWVKVSAPSSDAALFSTSGISWSDLVTPSHPIDKGRI